MYSGLGNACNFLRTNCKMVTIDTLVRKHHWRFHETKGPFTAVFPALHMALCVVFVFNKYLLTD